MIILSHFFSLVKIAHTIFAFPFTLIGFFIGLKLNQHHNFPYSLLLWVSLDLFFARNAAMAFNRIVDAKIDAQNQRTAQREIPSGKLSTIKVVYFIILNILLFIAVAWMINPICFYLSPIALIIILGYSYTKRFTILCHFILGLGLALAPMGAFLAVEPTIHWNMLWLSAGVLFWVSGFDILYALQDVDFDRKMQLFSLPSRLGFKTACIFSRYLHVLCLLFLAIFGYSYNLHYLFWIGFTIFALLISLQHYLIRDGNLTKLNLAFFTNNGLASVLFCIFTLLDLTN